MDPSELQSWDRYLGGMETIPVRYRDERLWLRITDSEGNPRVRAERRLYFPQKIPGRR